MKKSKGKTFLGDFIAKFGMKLDLERDYWITSDLHFGHKNILKFCPDTRPFSDLNHMIEAIVLEWNSLVKPTDVVFHLGDFSFLGLEATTAILKRLNGTIVFVMGNHDKTVRDQLQTKNKFEYLEVRYKGNKLCLFHYAMRVWNSQHFGAIHFYGHSHGSLPDYKRSMDVGYDAHGSILSLNTAVNQMLKNEDFKTEDHH